MNANLLYESQIKKHLLKLSTIILFMVFNSIGISAQVHTNFIQLDPTLNNKSLYISHTIQDHKGYIWMAHSIGIEKYDGYNYSHINFKEIFKNSDNNDYIKGIYKDNKDNIWITTQNGMVSVCDTLGRFKEFNSIKGKTIQTIYTNNTSVLLGSKNGVIYKFNHDNKQLEIITNIPNISPNSSEIISISENNSNEIFISTDKGKIYQYSIEKKELTTINGPFSDYPGNIRTVLDKSNKLWIGTETLGLFVYDIGKKQFIQDTFFKGPHYNIKNEMFISLFCDNKGVIWAGSDGGGLYQIDSNSGSIHLFTHHDTNKYSLSSNTVIGINEDSHKNIWVLANYGGLNIIPGGNPNILYHEGSENNSPSRVLSILKSKKGALWVGTDGTGLTKIITNNNGSTSEKQYFTARDQNKGFYIQSIIEDDQFNIWFGTYKNGLWFYNSKKNSFKRISIENSAFQKAKDVRTLFKDSKQRIWVGSALSLNIYSSNQKLLATFDKYTHGLKGEIAESFIEDEKGNIWVGYLKGGLFKFEENLLNLQNSSFINYSYFDEKAFSTDILGIKQMALGDSNTLWFLNSHGKLSTFNTLNYSHKTYKNFEPFNNANLRSILVEDKNNLWLSSSNGLFHFNVKDSIVTPYYDIDGFQDNFFLPRSAFKDKNGMFYFGGIKGLNIFNPKNITKKESKAKLHLNSLEILNQPAPSLIPDQMTSSIDQLEKIVLEDKQSSFSFRFSAIDNVLNPNFHYAYRLHGFDKDWIAVKKEQLATYTNIPSGNYTFEVKSGLKKGIWDIPSKKINIKILQPFWNHPFAYIIYLLILALLSYWLKKWYTLRNNLLSEKISNKKERELHNLKMIFFAKMSHEIQTPLTLISSPIDDMLTRAKSNGNLLLEQRLQIISNNVNRLSRIVFELTTVRNKELEKIRLLVTKNNLFEEINQIALSFKEQARFKKIDFTINCPKNLSEVWYDKDKFEHIIYNLLSNAFKFTPKEGNIQLIALPINNKNSIKITISDSGPGIPKEELEDIFTLFYQSKIGKQNKGTGIGLALTKELIDLHRGKVEVNSSPTEGTCFTITFPITEDAYLEEERIMTSSKTIETDDLEIIDDQIKTTTNKKIDKTILIVEDNFELQHFLKDLLSPIYNIILAENGEEGYYYAKSNLPDLILSDIMMPKLDGIEMSKMLQKNHLTKHIPIVLLTAKNSTNSKISGLKAGAIEFINKPFNTNELILKINNIITSTEHIISKFKKEIISTPEINVSKTLDDIFLDKLVSAINSQIENPNFKMEELADLVNMSYSTLYRKCQSLTGQSLVDFVRILRLKKAAIVIAKYGYNISEAAYVSGFNDPKYFSKCFKKHFEKSPNTFKKEAQEIGYEIYLKKLKLDNYQQ